MPDEDGYSLAREISERDARSGKRTPMIALTGYASAGDLREALERGFDTHLAKPVDPESLAVQIGALVQPAAVGWDAFPGALSSPSYDWVLPCNTNTPNCCASSVHIRVSPNPACSAMAAKPSGTYL